MFKHITKEEVASYNYVSREEESLPPITELSMLRERVLLIRYLYDVIGDNESAHIIEDGLLKYLIDLFAKGVLTPEASKFIKKNLLDVPRVKWYA